MYYGHLCTCVSILLDHFLGMVSCNPHIPRSAQHIVQVTALAWSKHLFPCLEHLPGTMVENMMSLALTLSVASETVEPWPLLAAYLSLFFKHHLQVFILLRVSSKDGIWRRVGDEVEKSKR